MTRMRSPTAAISTLVNVMSVPLCAASRGQLSGSRASREPRAGQSRWRYSHFDVYGKFDLLECPFNVHALLADERGQRLWVGLDTELHQVVRKLQIGTGIVCLEGHPGIGKTSLVKVAAKRCLDLCIGGRSPNLILPLHDSMQLSKKVAAARLHYRHSFVDEVPSREGSDVEAWLTSPVARMVS